jgi:hypothetical protein
MNATREHAVAASYPPPAAGLERLRRFARAAGVLGGLGCLAGALTTPEQFFRSYLVGHVFWLTIALGSLGLVLMHRLTQGAWGIVVRRVFEAAASTLPWMALLFTPVLLGMDHLYPWARPEVVARDPLLQAKAKYLDVPFFVARAVLFFGVWSVLARLQSRWSDAQDRSGAPALFHRLRALSAAGLILFVLTCTFASFDWLMSLDPHWFSSIYGVQFVGGAAVAALTFTILVTRFMGTAEPMSRVLTPKLHQDHGTLLFAFLLLWGYFSVSQFLIIWSANLPEEIPFYLHRQSGGWQYVALGLVVLHFAVPFLLLLSPRVKRDPRRLAAVAALVLAMRWIDLLWQVVPNFSQRVTFHWLDAAALVGVGGAWLLLFARHLAGRSLLPVHDPFLPEALAHE